MPEQEGLRRTVLFLCTENSARSQMAEGFLNALYGDRYEASSAGTKPTHLNPLAVEAMNETGIDLSHQRAKSVDEFVGREFDFIVTVCDRAREACPYFPYGATLVHHGFEDPAGQGETAPDQKAVFRKVRDEIKAWIEERFGSGE